MENICTKCQNDIPTMEVYCRKCGRTAPIAKAFMREHRQQLMRISSAVPVALVCFLIGVGLLFTVMWPFGIAVAAIGGIFVIRYVQARKMLRQNIPADARPGHNCPDCGTSIAPGDCYCGICGKRLRSR